LSLCGNSRRKKRKEEKDSFHVFPAIAKEKTWREGERREKSTKTHLPLKVGRRGGGEYVPFGFARKAKGGGILKERERRAPDF